MKPIHEMTSEEVNRELCKRLGIHFHERVGNKQCTCGESFEDYVEQGNHVEELNPDFYFSPVMLLREMRKRKDWWQNFYMWASDHARLLDYNSKGRVFIAIDCLLDDDGLLARTALEFLRKEQG